MRRFDFFALLLPLVAGLMPGSLAFGNSSQKCNASTFSFPSILGAELIDLTANTVHNFSRNALLPGTDLAERQTVSFCNVTVSYSHIGWGDTINVSVWIPLQGWNERMLGLGGGGFSASFGSLYQTAAVAKGFVAIGTDSGHEAGLQASTDPSFWMVNAPGNLHTNLVEDWASKTLGELSTIGKKAVRDFFNQGPSYSYFTGCSGGGRQGLELAQAFPTAFDGVLAAAPATYIETFLVSGYYPTLLMDDLNSYPAPCEIQAFTQAAVNHCDELDGLKDGIISNSSACQFNASDLVGEAFLCNEMESTFSETGAKIVQAAWDGPHNSEASWPGVSFDADLSASAVTTECNDSNNNCTSASGESLFGVAIKNLILANPGYDLEELTADGFFRLLALASAKFRQWVGAANPQLLRFHQAGGKLITWHGGADEVIPTRGSAHYYEAVLAQNADVTDFFRHFEAPGVGHCAAGAGPMPNSALEQLMDWVENGIAPETLDAYSLTTGMQRPLCPYPSEQAYNGGNSSAVESFACVPK